MAGSRTENAAKNLKVAVICKLGLFGMAFVVRTVFIRILGAEYTGVSSLYSNLLSLLNLAEFGFGSVLTYELYKPLKEDDEETITALVALFKKIYSVVIAVFLGSGLLLIPFLGVIVKSNLNSRDLLIYYLLYLLNSVVSYFVAYRTVVIEADQKRYIENLIDIGSKFVMYLCQTVYIVFTKDFLGYLVLQIFFTVLINVILHGVSLKMYPYLKKLPRTQKIGEETRKRIYSNSRSMFITKLSGVVLNQTDSIIISILFGTVMVGFYSNYYMLITYILSIYGIVFSSIEASVGNLNVDANSEKSFRIYKRLDYMLFCANLICTVVFLCVVQDFVCVWIGEKNQLGFLLVISLLFTFYLQCAMNITSTFRQTMGLFVVTKRVYPVMAVLNVALSVILGRWIGVAGVALATGVSRLFTAFWYEGKYVYLKMGHQLGEYLRRQAGFFLVLIVTGGIAYYICNNFPMMGVLAVLVKGIVSFFIAIAALVITGSRTEEWKWMRRRICSVLKRKKSIDRKPEGSHEIQCVLCSGMQLKSSQRGIFMTMVFFITKSHRFPCNMISYLESNFPDIKKEYFVVDRKQEVQLQEAANVHRILSYVEFLKNRSLVRMIRSADGIVVSGVFTMQYVFPIYGKSVLHKVFWQFWGGDYEKFRSRKRLTWKLRVEKWIIARNLREARGTILLTRQEADAFQEVFPEALKKKVYYAIVPSGTDDAEMIRRIRLGRARQSNDQGQQLQTKSIVGEIGRGSPERENAHRRIVIGNSSTDSNRHLELFERIKHLDLTNVNLYCPLSYGEKEYRDEVIERGYELFGNHFHPLTEYMLYEEYVQFLSTCDVGIYNNNRQQALGNINRMLDFGKKVYLPTMLRDYCTTYGYITYAVEDIAYSSIRELLDFPPENVEHNVNCIEARTRDIYKSWRGIFDDVKAFEYRM